MSRLLCTLLLVCLSPLAHAERLRLVSDDWAPYIYWQDGQPKGIDYEVASEVLKRLGIDVDWQLMPWKRCLAVVQQGLADGVMDIFRVGSRKPFMFYPDEPLSDVEFVLFQNNAKPHAIERLEDLTGLTVGTSPGYTYSPAFSDSSLFRREAAPTHEANFGKLMLGRIDLLVIDRRAGRQLLRQLGLEQQVQELPLVISRHAQYLGLAHKPGREQLARAFADELRRFKQEPAYAAIGARYERAMRAIPDTVEQHEHSRAR